MHSDCVTTVVSARVMPLSGLEWKAWSRDHDGTNEGMGEMRTVAWLAVMGVLTVAVGLVLVVGLLAVLSGSIALFM